ANGNGGRRSATKFDLRWGRSLQISGGVRECVVFSLLVASRCLDVPDFLRVERCALRESDIALHWAFPALAQAGHFGRGGEAGADGGAEGRASFGVCGAGDSVLAGLAQTGSE